MKVEIDGNTIRIKGDKVGEYRHLKVYCDNVCGDDYYSVSVVKDGLEIGCGPFYYMNGNNIIEQSASNGRRIIN